jgi:magnesium transporter
VRVDRDRVVTAVLDRFDAAQSDEVDSLREQGRFFWLDVSLSETSQSALVDALAIPDRAVDALSAHGDGYISRTLQADGDFVIFPLHCHVRTNAADDEAYRWQPLEVVVLVTGDYLLTVHDEPVSLPDALALDLPAGRSKPYVVYAVLDAMLASTFDALNEVELRLDGVASMWTGGGGGRMPRATLRESGARLATMRRWVGSEQAVFERVGVELRELPGFGAPDEGYFARLEERASRLVTSIDAAANGMGMLLDLQLNERAYLVSVVATIFVPLTFLTGFFGMNFGWMIDRISSPLAFWVLGLGVPAAAGLLCWRLLVRRTLTYGS